MTKITQKDEFLIFYRQFSIEKHIETHHHYSEEQP